MISVVDDIKVFARPNREPSKQDLIVIKSTYTIEDVVFMHARMAASSKRNPTRSVSISADMRKQITRVPYVQ
jgi:hypothetical protein